MNNIINNNNIEVQETEQGNKERFVMIKYVMRADMKFHIKNFNDNHLLMYATIQRYTSMRGTIDFRLNDIYEDLKIDSTTLKSELKQSLFDLIEFNLIELVDDNSLNIDKINKNTRIRLKQVTIKDDFKQIYDSELDKIFNSEHDIRAKKTMLYLFTILVSRIDDKNYCYPSYASLKRDLKTSSDTTITDNLNRLRELKLIEYENCGTIITESKEITQSNNIYVRCITNNHKSILNEQINKRKADLINHKSKISDNKKANKKRSESMTEVWKQRKEVKEVNSIDNVIDNIEIDKVTSIDVAKKIDLANNENVKNQVDIFVAENTRYTQATVYKYLNSEFDYDDLSEFVKNENMIYEILNLNREVLKDMIA